MSKLNLFKSILQAAKNAKGGDSEDINNENSLSIYEEFFKAGVEYYNNKEYDKSIEVFLSILAMNNNDAEAVLMLGKIFFDTGQTEKAMLYFILYTKLNPEDLEGYFNLALCYGKSNQADKERECYETMLELKPYDFSTNLVMGNMFLNNEKPELAIKYYIKAEKACLDNSDEIKASLYYFMSHAYILLSNVELAIKYLRQVLDISPKEPQCLFLLASLIYENSDTTNKKAMKEAAILTKEAMNVGNEEAKEYWEKNQLESYL